MTDRITESGKYAVTVQALSADISAIANGAVGEKSPVFDTSITSGKVEEELDDSDLKEDPDNSLENVMEEFTVDELRTAMQTDDSVLAKMKELDEAYAKKHGIKVGNAVDPAVAALGVDSSKVSMVGAALNAGAGNVTLEMKVAEEKKDINTNRYKNSVQIDLKLNTTNGYKSKLDVPVTITMPAPSGLDLGKLTILHFCQDGTEEVISPKNNGDGTITFTVTKFSTFVFAEDHGEKEEEPTAGGWWYYDPEIDGPVDPSLSAGSKISPKTADNSMFLYVAMLAVAACGVMVCKTRKVK